MKLFFGRRILIFVVILFISLIALPQKLAQNTSKETYNQEGYYLEDTVSSKESTIKKGLLQEAEEKFKEEEYTEAVSLYKKSISKNSDKKAEIFGKIGDCYYFNSQFKKALKWHKKSYKKDKKGKSSEYLFRYMTTLKKNQKTSESEKIRKEYLAKISEEEKEQQLLGKKEKSIENLKQLKTMYPLKVLNLKINSKESEFSPMYYGNSLVYAAPSKTRSGRKHRGWDGKPFLDLYTTVLDKETGEVGEPSDFSEAINTVDHEASVVFTKDGKTMFFTRNNNKKGYEDLISNKIMILKSTKSKGKWGKPKVLDFIDNNYSYGHPALSADEKKLYFISNIPESLGETDIFVVDIKEDGTYSVPKNLGREINTIGREMFPFISENKLYFSSDGHPGLGELDVFRAEITEEGFSTPENLGEPINSIQDDFSFIVKEKDSTGYFASNREGGKGEDDIYYFSPKKVAEEKIIANEIIANTKHNNLITKDIDIRIDEVDEEDQQWVIADKNSELSNETAETENSSYTTHEGETVYNNIFFGFDKSNIDATAAKELQKLVAFMKEKKNVRIKIRSHTDSRGNKIYNKKLSQERANSTLEYLINNGIDSHRIDSAKGFGETELTNECSDQSTYCNEYQHSRNRRSEIIILS